MTSLSAPTKQARGSHACTNMTVVQRAVDGTTTPAKPVSLGLHMPNRSRCECSKSTRKHSNTDKLAVVRQKQEMLEQKQSLVVTDGGQAWLQGPVTC